MKQAKKTLSILLVLTLALVGGLGMGHATSFADDGPPGVPGACNAKWCGDLDGDKEIDSCLPSFDDVYCSASNQGVDCGYCEPAQ